MSPPRTLDVVGVYNHNTVLPVFCVCPSADTTPSMYDCVHKIEVVTVKMAMVSVLIALCAPIFP